MDPFIVLNVSEEADDITIKNAYLTAIQTYSPERYPDQFSLIRSAYELIATERDRLKFFLMNPSPIDNITAMLPLLSDGQQAQFDETAFRHVLLESVLSSFSSSQDSSC